MYENFLQTDFRKWKKILVSAMPRRLPITENGGAGNKRKQLPFLNNCFEDYSYVAALLMSNKD